MTFFKKTGMLAFWARITALLVMVGMLTGCGDGVIPKSDEEITAELAQQFIVALYTQNKEVARKICNDTGYSTYEALAGMISMGTMGMDMKDPGLEAQILSSTNVVKTTIMESKTKAVVTLIVTLNQNKPQEWAIPLEKDEKGEWKVAVTKASIKS